MPTTEQQPQRELEIYMASMAILKAEGGVVSPAIHALFFTLDEFVKRATELGADGVSYEMLRGATRSGHQSQHESISNETAAKIGILSQSARSERIGTVIHDTAQTLRLAVAHALRPHNEALTKQFNEAKARFGLPQFYFVFEPYTQDSLAQTAHLQRKLQGSRRPDHQRAVIVREFSSDQMENGRGKHVGLQHRALSPYPSDFDRMIPNKEALTVAEQVEHLATYLQKHGFSGLSLNLGYLVNNALFTSGKEAIPLLVQKGILAMVEVQPNRADLGKTVSMEQSAMLLEQIAATGWTGPLFFAPDSLEHATDQIQEMRAIFGRHERRE